MSGIVCIYNEPITDSGGGTIITLVMWYMTDDPMTPVM